MPRLAIIIPAIGSTAALEGTLLSVLENRPADCEIHVVLNRPYADPYRLDGEVRFARNVSTRPMTACVNEVLRATRAVFVHLLAAGCQVRENWTEQALERFGDRQVGSVAPLVFQADHPQRILAAGVGYRRGGKRYLIGTDQESLDEPSRAAIVGACGFAAFYRKSALDFVGGFCAGLGMQQADVDLGLILRSSGFSVALQPRCQILGSREVDSPESPFRQALHEERLFWRNLPADKRSGAMAAHAAYLAREALTSLPRPRTAWQIAARLCAMLQVPSYLRHRRAMVQLRERALRPRSDHARIDAAHGGTVRPLRTVETRSQVR